MLLDLRDILHVPGASLPFSFQMDLSDLDFYGRRPIAEPVEVKGVVCNRAEMLELEATASSNLHLICDSCGRPFERVQTVTVRRLLASQLEREEDEDEILLLNGTQFDAEEAMSAEFILAMDTKNLCREDCRGRCPTCGKDLNLGPCDCRPAADPRFAVLSRLLSPDDEKSL